MIGNGSRKVPTIGKNQQQRRPRKRFEQIEKIMNKCLGTRRPLDVLTGAETLLELLNQPTNQLTLRMVALIVCLFEVASFAERAETILKFA